jgi:hypothetical protein
MKVLLSMPFEVYEGLLAKCSMLSREYLILKNGVVKRDQGDAAEKDVVEVMCDGQRAKFLLDFAILIFPTAVPYIEKSIEDAREDPQE